MSKQNETQEFSTNNLDKTTEFINRNKKILSIIVAAIVVIAGGIYAYYTLVAKPNSDKANYMLSKSQTYFNAGNFDLALNGDNAGSIGFLNIAKQYSSTDAGNLANLYAGLCYSEKEDAQNAVKYLEAFSTKGDALISPASMAALGNAYAKLGQTDKAIDKLKAAAKSADCNSLSPIFLLQAGELLESQGKKDEALKCYQTIKDKYTQSPLFELVDKYIARVAE